MSKEENNSNKGFLTLVNIRDILIVAILVIVTWKLLGADISITFESFSFTDLLSVLLAFFAIALSVAFYFKATDTSNMFYDNSYKFTKEISEILGRIESGFGEKLKHIDDGYTGLRDKFDRMPFDVDRAKEEEKKEKEHIKEQEEEMNRVILNLIERARIADDEKEQVMSQLEQSAKELDRSKRELRRLQRDINRVQSDISDVPKDFIAYLANRIEGHFSSKYINAPTRILNRHFRNVVDEEMITSGDIDFMTQHDLVSAGALTEKGAKVLRLAIEKSI